MSALKDIFPGWQEGTSYSMEEKEEWALLNLGRGDFVEIPLESTDWDPVSKASAGFVIMDRLVTGDGGLALRAHGVGCSDAQLNKRISNQFNRREGFLHLCVGRPCTEAEEGYLHVTRLRAFTREGFNASYFMAAHRRQVAKWLDGDEPTEEARAGEEAEMEAGHHGDRSILSDLSWLGEDAGREEEASHKRRAEEAKLKPSPKGRAARVSALRPGRAASQARARGKGVAFGSGEELKKSVQVELDERGREDRESAKRKEDKRTGGWDAGLEENPEQMSTTELRKRLDAVRERLGGPVRASIKDLKRLPEEEDGEDQSQEREEGSGFAEEKLTLTSGTTLKKKTKVEATRGSSSKDVSTQLVRQAQHLAEERMKRRGGERKQERLSEDDQKTERERLLALLNQAEKKGHKRGDGDKDPPKKSRERSRSSKKKKRKKEKKRSKKRKLVNGVIVSTSPSGSSPEDSSGSSGSSSEDQLEAPLGKRSKACPGAVLKLLVQKAQAALDQGALVEINRGGGSAITEGVKLMTYFQLHVKPHYGHLKGPMRDLSLEEVQSEEDAIFWPATSSQRIKH